MDEEKRYFIVSRSALEEYGYLSGSDKTETSKLIAGYGADDDIVVIRGVIVRTTRVLAEDEEESS